MANPEHLALLQQGVATWNEWRKDKPNLQVDLSGADLTGPNLSDASLSGADLSKAILFSANLHEADLHEAKLYGADLREADLSGANLSGANLNEAMLFSADLRGADLSEAGLHEANLSWANLSGANLNEAVLAEANLRGADLRGAILRGAILFFTQLTGTDIGHADLTGSLIYGISAWDVELDAATRQENLIITPHGEPVITVDNIKVAQFIYLLLNNKEIRDVIDTITSKAVLILGRFSPERKIILDRLRDELRTRRYVPILFDFEKPKSRDTVETIRTLAGMSKFIIADLTDAKSVVQELQGIVPDFPSVAVRFIILESEQEPGMLDHIMQFRSVVSGAFEYKEPEEVIGSINDKILEPVEAKLRELSELRVGLR